MSTTQPTIVYAGDERPEQFSGKLATLVHIALNRVLHAVGGDHVFADAIDSGIVERASLSMAIELPPVSQRDIVPVEHTVKLIAALTEIEAALFDKGDDFATELAEVQRALRATGRRLVERGSERGWLPYDIFFILDDDTAYYSDKGHLSNFNIAGVEKFVGGVEAVYFFDRSKNVNLCEITPSYELNFFEARAFIKNDVSDADESEADRVRGEVEDALREPGLYEDVTYRHVRDVESLLTANKRGAVFHYGNPGFDLNEVRDEVLDKLGRNMNQKRKEKGLKPLSDVEIEKEWADQLDEQIEMAVYEKLREAVQGNPVL